MPKTITVHYAGGHGKVEVTIPGPFASVAEIKRANREIGHHYFDADTMRYFRSKPSETTIKGRFFVDSIQFDPNTPRQYRVKMAHDNGRIESVAFPGDAEGVYIEYFDSRRDAVAALQAFLGGAE